MEKNNDFEEIMQHVKKDYTKNRNLAGEYLIRVWRNPNMITVEPVGGISTEMDVLLTSKFFDAIEEHVRREEKENPDD